MDDATLWQCFRTRGPKKQSTRVSGRIVSIHKTWLIITRRHTHTQRSSQVEKNQYTKLLVYYTHIALSHRSRRVCTTAAHASARSAHSQVVRRSRPRTQLIYTQTGARIGCGCTLTAVHTNTITHTNERRTCARLDGIPSTTAAAVNDA